MSRNISILLSVLIFIISSCKKVDQYQVEPVIEFKSLTTQKDAGGFDIGGKVVISFTDGDGDLGYNSSGNGSPYDDKTSPYYNNFLIKAFEKKNGIWVADTVKLDGRFPYLTPEGTNKALKGDIAMDVFLRPHQTNDTLHYEVFIYDRGFHKSNTITTSDIIITTR